VSKGRRPDHPGEEVWVVVADEGVVLREDVVGSGQVETRDLVPTLLNFFSSDKVKYFPLARLWFK
jgi:hypothetical protein